MRLSKKHLGELKKIIGDDISNETLQVTALAVARFVLLKELKAIDEKI